MQIYLIIEKFQLQQKIIIHAFTFLLRTPVLLSSFLNNAF